ncbi:MAG: hypothetical protein AAF739_18140 [Pseudomonadota bacterium]
MAFSLFSTAVAAQCPDMTAGAPVGALSDVTYTPMVLITFADGRVGNDGGLAVTTPHRPQNLVLDTSNTCETIFIVPYQNGAPLFTDEELMPGTLVLQAAMIMDSAGSFQRQAPDYFRALENDGRVIEHNALRADVLAFPAGSSIEITDPIVADAISTHAPCGSGTVLVAAEAIIFLPC